MEFSVNLGKSMHPPTLESWEVDFLDLLKRPKSNFSDKDRWLLDWVRELLARKKSEVLQRVYKDHNEELTLRKRAILADIEDYINGLRTPYPGNYDSAFDSGFNDCKEMMRTKLAAMREDVA